jgi:hypothetical protein
LSVVYLPHSLRPLQVASATCRAALPTVLAVSFRHSAAPAICSFACSAVFSGSVASPIKSSFLSWPISRELKLRKLGSIRVRLHRRMPKMFAPEASYGVPKLAFGIILFQINLGRLTSNRGASGVAPISKLPERSRIANRVEN